MIELSKLAHQSLVLYSDVDGTLVSENNQVSPVVVKEALRWVEAGFEFSLATGRNFHGVQRIAKALPITAPLVLCNGAYVYHPATQDACYVQIQKPVLEILLPLLLGLPDAVVYLDSADRVCFVSDRAVLDDAYARTEQLNLCVLSDWASVVQNHDIVKVGLKLLKMSPETEKHLLRTLDTLNQELPKELHYCFSYANYVEFMAQGVSKWSGIQTGQTMQGLQECPIIAVGDQHNDIEMVTHAHIGVAMGNAVDALKKHADYCIARVEQDGLADFLRFVRIEMRGKSNQVFAEA